MPGRPRTSTARALANVDWGSPPPDCQSLFPPSSSPIAHASPLRRPLGDQSSRPVSHPPSAPNPSHQRPRLRPRLRRWSGPQCGLGSGEVVSVISMCGAARHFVRQIGCAVILTDQQQQSRERACTSATQSDGYCSRRWSPRRRQLSSRRGVLCCCLGRLGREPSTHAPLTGIQL